MLFHLILPVGVSVIYNCMTDTDAVVFIEWETSTGK